MPGTSDERNAIIVREIVARVRTATNALDLIIPHGTTDGVTNRIARNARGDLRQALHLLEQLTNDITSTRQVNDDVCARAQRLIDVAGAHYRTEVLHMP